MNDFDDFMREVEAEAKAEGPEAVAEMEALEAHFRLGVQLVEARMARKLTQEQVAKKAGVRR